MLVSDSFCILNIQVGRWNSHQKFIPDSRPNSKFLSGIRHNANGDALFHPPQKSPFLVPYPCSVLKLILRESSGTRMCHLSFKLEKPSGLTLGSEYRVKTNKGRQKEKLRSPLSREFFFFSKHLYWSIIALQ